ncbi:unnamed protein product [Caretta caretta]
MMAQTQHVSPTLAGCYPRDRALRGLDSLGTCLAHPASTASLQCSGVWLDSFILPLENSILPNGNSLPGQSVTQRDCRYFLDCSEETAWIASPGDPADLQAEGHPSLDSPVVHAEARLHSKSGIQTNTAATLKTVTKRPDCDGESGLSDTCAQRSNSPQAISGQNPDPLCNLIGATGMDRS